MNVTFADLRHVYKSPAGDSRTVLDIARWEVDGGQQILLRGVSGSGKTTLFNIAAGLLAPTEGTVTYDGQKLYALAPGERDRFRARHTGYIFQTHYLLAPLTALENVVMPMAFARKYPAGQWKRDARDLLGRVGLAEYAHYRPAQMSTGQRLRVAVARALANRPDVLLADEPTAALDAGAAQTVMDLVQAICRENGASLIVASHDPALAARFPLAVDLEHGRLIAQAAEPLYAASEVMA
ncbi:ABC transporter ATP-binding protein [Aggregatilinea lenta]|uniref:ABC transporter ATP-binding protein n=1 Tax=Aggregatilinea lenta TaxID=913108 RepID=UPI000E5A9740|nr:ABC transporter ATP-binding protein [Aggregatilinea lenta]